MKKYIQLKRQFVDILCSMHSIEKVW